MGGFWIPMGAGLLSAFVFVVAERLVKLVTRHRRAEYGRIED